jgi:sulfoacetaldehyde acetyltransferase
MVIFRNYQWGAEKRNTTLWYDNNFVGTELDRDTSYAADCRGLWCEGCDCQQTSKA